MKENDKIRLEHILEAIQDIFTFIEGMSLEEFTTVKKDLPDLQNSIMNALKNF